MLDHCSQDTTLFGKSPELSARRLKVMQSLGLIAPSGSPFHKMDTLIWVCDKSCYWSIIFVKIWCFCIVQPKSLFAYKVIGTSILCLICLANASFWWKLCCGDSHGNNPKLRRKKGLSLVVSTEFFEIETSIWFTFFLFFFFLKFFFYSRTLKRVCLISGFGPIFNLNLWGSC